MILGPYRNPPYRIPAPKTESEPSTLPPAHPSPKRKRNESMSSLIPLQVSNSVAMDQPIEVPSPRTKVAEHLQSLEISHHQQTTENDDLPESPRKRIRPNDRLDRPQHQLRPARPSTPVQASPGPVTEPATDVLEIEETPDWRVQTQAMRPTPSTSHLAESEAHSDILHPASSTPSRRLHSPPPPTPVTQCPASPPDGKQQKHKTDAPNDQDDDMEFDQAQLTWQDNEITGQDIDTTIPDDDGLGINGIGFRPTPAIAFARSQKRRQQVNEWKLREAREARQRRIERRRGGSSPGAKRTPTVKRTVRFAAIG